MAKITRRNLLTTSSRLAGSLAMGLPLIGQDANGESSQVSSKIKVVVTGAHPDDPESGCGGTIARYSDLGHEVVLLYLTRGEAGIPGKSEQQAATIRTEECLKACAILKARPVFAGQIDGRTEVDGSQYSHIQKILEAEQPSVLFTQWPIDGHRDHRAMSLLAYDYWLKSRKKVGLFYYEVETGTQTQIFHPTHYVDISQTESRKHAACLAHASQRPATAFYPMHQRMAEFRGMECGCRVAEAFIRHDQNAGETIPGL
ncbi:MAG: PIG-L family deacetylase [Acidobacteriaceae bacterium]